VIEKPSFKQAFARRRCVILADGFYEWKRPEGKSGPTIPFYFRLLDRKPFGFAGLWETWRTPEGELLKTCTILTTAANEVVAPVHDRMPVILRGAELWRWILPAQPDEHLSMLKPLPQNALDRYVVSRLVNAPGNDIKDCILPVSI
jgi:putative SOS response-associated peptidase YedK